MLNFKRQMLYWDSTYLDAKKVKEGSKKLRPEFELLKVFLRDEYFVILLNADIYFEPVVTTLDPSLRLVIDNEVKKTSLPIYYLSRINKMKQNNCKRITKAYLRPFHNLIYITF